MFLVDKIVLLGGLMLLLGIASSKFSARFGVPVLVLFLAIGMLQRDGLMILLGYLLNVATLLYFAAIAIGVILAGQSLSVLFTEPAPGIILNLLR